MHVRRVRRHVPTRHFQRQHVRGGIETLLHHRLGRLRVGHFRSGIGRIAHRVFQRTAAKVRHACAVHLQACQQRLEGGMEGDRVGMHVRRVRRHVTTRHFQRQDVRGGIETLLHHRLGRLRVGHFRSGIGRIAHRVFQRTAAKVRHACAVHLQACQQRLEGGMEGDRVGMHVRRVRRHVTARHFQRQHVRGGVEALLHRGVSGLCVGHFRSGVGRIAHRVFQRRGTEVRHARAIHLQARQQGFIDLIRGELDRIDMHIAAVRGVVIALHRNCVQVSGGIVASFGSGATAIHLKRNTPRLVGGGDRIAIFCLAEARDHGTVHFQALQARVIDHGHIIDVHDIIRTTIARHIVGSNCSQHVRRTDAIACGCMILRLRRAIHVREDGQCLPLVVERDGNPLPGGRLFDIQTSHRHHLAPFCARVRHISIVVKKHMDTTLLGRRLEGGFQPYRHGIRPTSEGHRHAITTITQIMIIRTMGITGTSDDLSRREHRIRISDMNTQHLDIPRLNQCGIISRMCTRRLLKLLTTLHHRTQCTTRRGKRVPTCRFSLRTPGLKSAIRELILRKDWEGEQQQQQ